MSFHWTCPYCDRDTTITSTYSTDTFVLHTEGADGYRHFGTLLIVCPNPECTKFTLTITMYEGKRVSGQLARGKFLQSWDLIPPSRAKVFPEYIPEPIRKDYVEACLIRDLSPKASATLSRRCLQGIIRDFWKISKARLVDEIDAINDKTDPLIWDAIDGVRKIGNIGAHMEKDINVIVEVDPQEAQKLIELIELLVKEWYIVRHQRQEKLKSIVEISKAKQATKSGNATPVASEGSTIE